MKNMNSLLTFISAFSVLLMLNRGCCKQNTVSKPSPIVSSDSIKSVIRENSWYIGGTQMNICNKLCFGTGDRLMIDNAIDTLFYCKYMVQGDSLIIFSGDEKKYISRVLFIAPELLVVDKIWGIEGPHVYEKVTESDK